MCLHTEWFHRGLSTQKVLSLQENEDLVATKNFFNTESTRLSHMNDLDEAALWYERCLAIDSRNVACLCK